jgi:hypothetical protein
MVNIHKSNKFGIKNWLVFSFVGVNGAKEEEEEEDDNNKHQCHVLFLSRAN